MCTSKVTTIQALLLMSDVLFAWMDERSVAWHYLSMATSMILDLGLHVERRQPSSERLASLEKTETRRRVFWSAFSKSHASLIRQRDSWKLRAWPVLDKIQSIYQGRPARLRDTDCSVPAVFMDEFEEFEPFKTHGYSLAPGEADSPTYSVSHFRHLCSLNVIADRILHEVYSQSSQHLSAGSLSAVAQSLQEQLDRWCESLPTHLSITFDTSGTPRVENGGGPLPHVLSLQYVYSHTDKARHLSLVSHFSHP